MAIHILRLSCQQLHLLFLIMSVGPSVSWTLMKSDVDCLFNSNTSGRRMFSFSGLFGSMDENGSRIKYENLPLGWFSANC